MNTHGKYCFLIYLLDTRMTKPFTLSGLVQGEPQFEIHGAYLSFDYD